MKLRRRLAPGPFEVIHGENGGRFAGSVRASLAMNKNRAGKFLESVEKPNQVVPVGETDRGHTDIHPLQSEFVGYGFFDIIPGLPGVRAAEIDNAPNLVFSNQPTKIPSRRLSGAVQHPFLDRVEVERIIRYKVDVLRSRRRVRGQ
jgi:hypothetical protein